MSVPVNVWFSGGLEYTDYRLPDGHIVTIETTPNHTRRGRIMTESEQQLREWMQPMLRDELMRSWREGVKVGLTMAYSMAEAVRNEAARHCDTGNECEQAKREAQIVVLRGLMDALTKAAEEAVKA